MSSRNLVAILGKRFVNTGKAAFEAPTLSPLQANRTA